MKLWEAIKRVDEEGGTAQTGSYTIRLDGNYIVFESVGMEDYHVHAATIWTYEPPAPNLVSAAEAFKALRDGKGIKRKGWDKNDHHLFVQKGRVWLSDLGDGIAWRPDPEDLVAEDWVIL